MRHQIVILACALLLPELVYAQNVSVSLTIEGLSYRGDDYGDTDGDRAITLAGGYRFHDTWQIGAGVFVGKFDHPISDPSFTAIAIFVEPSRVWQINARVRLFAGGRIAWEHERVGDQIGGLWAYGWSVGPTGGVDLSLTESLFVGASFTWAVLDLGRDVPGNETISRNGHRLQSGGRIGLRW